MEKKYKLKTNDITAQNSGQGDMYYIYNECIMIGKLPLFILEKSNDWELIEYVPDHVSKYKLYFEFTTEDGCKVVTPEHELNTLNMHTWKESSITPAFMSKDLDKNRWKFFYHRDNLLKYIEEHKPKFELDTEDGKVHNKATVVYYVHDNGTVYENTAAHWYMFKEMKVFIHKENAEKYSESRTPKVILTTRDGIDITDDYQHLYIVNKNSWTTGEESAYRCKNYKDQPYLVFSSKDKRDEYILNSKPLLTLTDVMSIVNTAAVRLGERNGIYSNLKELAKSKL